MILSKRRDGDLTTNFQNIDVIEKGINSSSMENIQTTIQKLTEELHDGNLPLEADFGLCNSFRQKIKGLGFELGLKTSKKFPILF